MRPWFNRLRPSPFTFLTPCIFLILLSVNSAAQRPETPPTPPTGDEFEWRFSVQQGDTASSDVTARNVCFKRHRFEVELQNLPFMTLLGPSAFDVKAGAEHKLPVKLDATRLSPGEYLGNVLIKCPTCPKEKGCTQDRQVLKVRMTVVPSTQPLQLNAPSLDDEKCECERLEISAKETVGVIDDKKKTKTKFDFGAAVETIKGKPQRRKLSLSVPYEAEIKCKMPKDALSIGKDDVCRGKVAIKIKKTDWKWENDKLIKVPVLPEVGSEEINPTELPCEHKCSDGKARVMSGNIVYTAIFAADKFPTEGTLELHFDPNCKGSEFGWKMIIRFKGNGKIDEKKSDYNGDGRVNEKEKDPWRRPLK